MYAVALLIVVALVSLLITRVATIALTVTGMTRQSARFQARSALSGVGFTTSESEAVVNHPIRRRVVMALMLIGSVGLATAVAGLLAGFLRADASQALRRAVLLLGGLAGVCALSMRLKEGATLYAVDPAAVKRSSALDRSDGVAGTRLARPPGEDPDPVAEDDQDDGGDDGHDGAQEVELEDVARAEGVRHNAAENGADHSQQERHPQREVLATGHDETSDGADDKAENEKPDHALAPLVSDSRTFRSYPPSIRITLQIGRLRLCVGVRLLRRGTPPLHSALVRPGLFLRVGALSAVTLALCGVKLQAGAFGVGDHSRVGTGLIPLATTSVATDPAHLRFKLDWSGQRFSETRRAKHNWPPLTAVVAAISLLVALRRGFATRCCMAIATGRRRFLLVAPRGPPSLQFAS